MFAALTAMTFFLVALSLNRCMPESDPEFLYYHSARCAEDEYSPMATLFFNTEGGTIRSLLSKGVELTAIETFSFFLAWYFLFITTYGVQVPSGVFLPGIIIGLSVGQLYGILYTYAFPMMSEQQSYLLVGAAAMLTSYVRMTYSLTVIMLETTQSINLFIPTIFAVIVARSVGKFYTRSLYEISLRAKNIPLLKETPPFGNRFVRAQELMSSPVVCLDLISSVQDIRKALLTSHQGFPLLNRAGKLVGILPRRFLKILIKHKEFIQLSILQNPESRAFKSTVSMFYSPQDQGYNPTIEEDPDERQSNSASQRPTSVLDDDGTSDNG